MEEHTLLVVVAAFHLISVHHHGGHAGDQVDALVQDIFQGQVLGVLVVGVQAQHTTLQLIHNVGGGGIHGIHKALWQGTVLCQDLAKIIQLLLGRQAAEQQQPDHFLKHEAVVAVGLLHDLVDVDASVDQLAGGGDHMSFLILFVAHNVTHVGQAGQHAGAVRVAQTALDAQTLTGLGVDVVVGNVLLAQGPHRGGVQGRHFCMCKIHGGSLLSSGSYFLLSHTFLPSSLMDIILYYRFCAVNSSAMCSLLTGPCQTTFIFAGNVFSQGFAGRSFYTGDRIFFTLQGRSRYEKSFSAAVHSAPSAWMRPASGRLPPHPRGAGACRFHGPPSAFVTGEHCFRPGNLRCLRR